MNDLWKKQTSFARIEFWAFTAFFVFTLFFFVADSLDGKRAIENAPFKTYFEQAKVPFSYHDNYFIPQFIRNICIYLSFIALNFIVVPVYSREKQC